MFPSDKKEREENKQGQNKKAVVRSFYQEDISRFREISRIIPDKTNILAKVFTSSFETPP